MQHIARFDKVGIVLKRSGLTSLLILGQRTFTANPVQWRLNSI